MKTSVGYKVMKPYISIFIAGFVCAQSVFATNGVATSGAAVGDHGFSVYQKVIDTVRSVEINAKQRGMGLSDAKRMMDAVQLGNNSAIEEFVRIDVTGTRLEPLKAAAVEKLKSLSTLHQVMVANRNALNVLINNPIKNPTVQWIYYLTTALNAIPMYMAFNDKNDTPLIKNNREQWRAFFMALPMVSSAILRHLDPTASISIEKMHADINAELGKLENIPGATAEFRKQIAEITQITSNQLTTAGNNYSMVDSAISSVVGHGGTGLSTAVAVGSLVFLILQLWNKKFGALAEKGLQVMEVVGKNKDTILKATQALAAKTQHAAGWARTLPETLRKGMATKVGTGSTSIANFGTDVVGSTIADTSKQAVLIARGIDGEYKTVVRSIEVAMEDLQKVLATK